MGDDPGGSPPRRRRSTPQAAKSSSFPLAPILVGVVLLGFVIGAGLSMNGKRTQGTESSPTPLVTLAPVATQTPQPLESPTPRETSTSHPTPTPHPTATPAATPSPQHAALVPSTARPALSTAAPPVRTAAPTAASAQTALPTARPAETARPAPTPEPTDDADSAFGRLSAAVVRQYLRSLMRGDTDSAYGAFGVTPGSKGVDLSERAIVDPATRIANVQARGGDDAQTVNLTLQTANGAYAAQYTLHRTSTGAAVIVSHTFSKL